jgi:hypothetical protein
MSVSNGHLLGRAPGIRHILLSLSLALGLCSALAQKAKADFIGNFTGDYALTNFTLTNTDNGGFPSFTNGFCSLFNDPADPKGPCGRSNTPDGQQSLQLTGGNGGSGIAGITDLVITATASGIVQFSWSYSSSDPSASANDPLSSNYQLGCGPQFTGPCDDAGYLLDGNYTQLADDSNQRSGLVTFSITAGETFGFRVNTFDNTGGPGILTISGPSSVPEPSFLAVLLGLTAAMMGAQRWKARKLRPHRGENN